MWRLVLVAAAFAGCVLAGRGTGEPGVQGALRAMLGLGLGTPPSGEDRAGRSAYMMELYKRYTSEGATNGTEANTVRSIQATVGRVGGQRVFLFNVSSVKETEEVLKAELHVYRKKKKRRFAIAIKLRRLSGGRLHELGSPREISRESYGWQSRDVSGDVSACMTQRRRRNLVLVATFSARRRNGRQVALRMAKFMRHMSPPFLVVFSKDAQNITLDQIDTRRGDDGVDSSFVHPESGRAERFGGRRMAKRGADATVDEASTDGVGRSRRSIFDNEIPEDPTKRVVDPPSDYSVPRSHPSILQGRTQYRKRVSKSRLLPYPPEFERRRRRRKHHRKQRRRNRLTYGTMGPRWGKRDGAATKAFNDVSDSTDTAHLCRRRKLVVDFADIGWSEWVISPKSFEAHYCAGACPFPMAQKLRPSNHATIQSLVQAVGLYTDVPAPCCVPEALSSVTLLYFDENQNVVLKNYPAMTVQSCACR